MSVREPWLKELERLNILEAIRRERVRQVEMWGDQSHPNADTYAENVNALYDIPSGAEARRWCEAEHEAGEGTWLGILVEELAEAGDECRAEGSDDRLRTELVQVAAVCVAWIEDIDKRKSHSEATG